MRIILVDQNFYKFLVSCHNTTVNINSYMLIRLQTQATDTYSYHGTEFLNGIVLLYESHSMTKLKKF